MKLDAPKENSFGAFSPTYVGKGCIDTASLKTYMVHPFFKREVDF